MNIPVHIKQVLDRLTQAGYDAYIVGGCVRDGLLGLTPHDWDICTSAMPEETMQVFADHTVIPTGIQHGTVTVLVDKEPLEITTYRTERDYGDHRHPNTVEFVRDIHMDLSRRDFTVNAMAYHPLKGLVDPFGGRNDLEQGLLRCVGDATERFEEDALRILRALRFSSTYGLCVESATKDALLDKSPLLSKIAPERIREELIRMVMGDHIGNVLRDFYAVLYPVLPELQMCDGFDQCSRYHCHDVLQHIIVAVESAEKELTVRLAALFHDIGKPFCFTCDGRGQGHFYGHADVSVRIADSILRRLRFDNKTREEVVLLIQYHDIPLDGDDRIIRRWMNRLGVPLLRRLLLLKKADAAAHRAELMDARFEELQNVSAAIDRLLEEDACFSLHDLAINGDDLLAIGIPEGPPIGKWLEWLLDEVIEQRLPNEWQALLQAVRKRLDYFNETR